MPPAKRWGGWKEPPARTESALELLGLSALNFPYRQADFQSSWRTGPAEMEFASISLQLELFIQLIFMLNSLSQ